MSKIRNSAKLAFDASRVAVKAFGLTLGAATSSIVVIGCGVSSSNTATLVTTCELPTAQSSTLAGKWAATPVPIAVHAGDFTTSDLQNMQSAADTWNTFYGQTLGSAVFDYGGAGSFRTSTSAKPAAICADSIISGTSFRDPVVIYKDTTWPYPNQPNAIALTTFCPTPGKPLPSFGMAIMEINYQNFFVSGRKLPDLQSIVLHELGHVAGLGHSCEVGSTTTGIPNCNTTDPSYLAAVMGPVFTFDQNGNGQVKQALTSNDEGRANCLYQSNAQTP